MTTNQTTRYSCWPIRIQKWQYLLSLKWSIITVDQLMIFSQHPANRTFSFRKTSVWPSLGEAPCPDRMSNPSLQLQFHLLSMPAVPISHLSNNNCISEPLPTSCTSQQRLWHAELCSLVKPEQELWKPISFCCHSFRVGIKTCLKEQTNLVTIRKQQPENCM